MTQPHFSRTQLRRAVLSSYLGSVIEYYDFLLYATASAIVFNKIFFPNLDPLVGTVASFGTLATGYLARPLGGIVFGHFGDRIGRKKMLVLSMILMGVGTTLIGVLPTYAQVGVWAPILLVLLRVVQGIAVGGEWGGAALMSVEHASARRGSLDQLHQRRRPDRRGALDRRAGPVRLPDRRGGVPRLGLADPVPAQHRPAGHRPVRAGPGRGDARLRRGRPRQAHPVTPDGGAASPPAQPPAVHRRRLRRVRRTGHHHDLRHLLRGAGRLPPRHRAERAHRVLGCRRLRHRRLLGAVRPPRTASRRAGRGRRDGDLGLRAVPADRQQVHGVARRRRRRRPGCRAHGVVRAARRALHRAVLHRLPATPEPRSATRWQALARASPPSRSPP